MRQKRQNLGGSTSAQASASAWQPVTEQQMEDDVEGQVITRPKLIVVSIEEALASLQQSTLQEFIMKTAPGHIGFKVRELTYLLTSAGAAEPIKSDNLTMSPFYSWKNSLR